MVQTVGKLPEFTDDASVEKEQEVTPEKEVTEEKETPSPQEEKPASEPSDDTAESEKLSSLEKAVESLQKEKLTLLKAVKELKGTRRELKQQRLEAVDQHLDDLKDMHPEDVSAIERVVRGKGYMTKEEASLMFYKTVQQEELDKFLNKFPEYKPENDPDNILWEAFERQVTKEKEIGYSLPKNPHLIGVFLERVHQSLSPKIRSDQAAAKRRIEIAGVGSGGSQESSSPRRLDERYRSKLIGFSDDDIKKIEERLQ